MQTRTAKAQKGGSLKKTRHETPSTPLVWNYGLFWDESAVRWHGKGAGARAVLLGNLEGKPVDFGEAKGVYALYKDYTLVYVGQAFSRPLGLRLREHRKDHKAGRWDRFSWFSLVKFNVTNKTFKNPAKTKNAKGFEVADTLEAFGIIVADPIFNRQRKHFPHAKEVLQIPDVEKTSLHKDIDEIKKTLANLTSSLKRRHPNSG